MSAPFGQLALLLAPPAAPPRPEPVARELRRRRDPGTSHRAAEKIVESGGAAAQCELILAAVRRYPGSTSRELGELGAGFDRYVAAKRLPVLERKGFVRRGGERPCRVTGNDAQTWWPT